MCLVISDYFISSHALFVSAVLVEDHITLPKMNTTNPVNPQDLFSAKDLVVVITGGGSG